MIYFIHISQVPSIHKPHLLPLPPVFLDRNIFFIPAQQQFQKNLPSPESLAGRRRERDWWCLPKIKDGRKKIFLTWYNSFLFSARLSHKNEHLGPTKIVHQKLVYLVKKTSSAWKLQTTRGFFTFYGSPERDQLTELG